MTLKDSEIARKKQDPIGLVGHWTWYPKTNKLIWSEEIFHIFGITKDQFDELQGDLDKIIDKTIYIDDRILIREAYRKVIDERQSANTTSVPTIISIPVPLEYRIVWPDGTIHTVLAQPGEKTIDSNGEVIKLFVIVQDITERKQIENTLRESIEKYKSLFEGGARDVVFIADIETGISATALIHNITERKQIENALIESIEKLRKSEENLRRAQRVAHVGNWEWDIKTRKVTWSEEVFHLFDLDPKEPEPTYEEHLKYYLPEDAQILEHKVEEALKNSMPYTVVCRTKHLDGSIHYLEGRGETILDDKGNVIKLFGTAMDITQYKLAEQKIKTANVNILRSNEELEQFAYIASHDLQEPLRTIYGFAELLELNYKGKLGPEADEFIGYITTGAKRMQQMINDLLTLSRIGTKGKEFVPTNIEKIINTVIENLRSLIDKNKAVITVDKMPTIMADEIQIVQLFQNLIDNAIKFRREEPPTIHISSKKQNGEWLFSVKDNGIGIDKNQFKKLFIIFHRLHSRDKYPGTGIGLAICKKIVERHGGRIWVESEIGIGSTFYFTIPSNKYYDR